MKIEECDKIRESEIIKLENAIKFPGRFSILVLGDQGTGKTHWIVKIIEDTDNKKEIQFFIESPIQLAGSLCEESKEFWEHTFKKADKKVLIIDEVEKLTNKCQEILFDGLSTVNGKLGFDEKTYEIILVFTSTFPINKLRDDRRFLTAKFFDRISQIVIEFPNFEKTQRSVYEDFNSTWTKMKFENEIPKSDEFQKWLQSEAYRMHGNFRDLDKIAINWHFQQSIEKDEAIILEKLKKEFREYLHNPSQKIYEDNIVVLDEDLKYIELLNNFRKKVKTWSIALNYGDNKKASEMLGISNRTMERW